MYKRITARYCKLTSSSLKTLAKWMKQNTSLNYLDISSNALVGCEGIEALADALKSNHTLHELHLSPCDITDNPSVLTNLLTWNKSIQTLHVTNSKAWTHGAYDQIFIFRLFLEGMKYNDSILHLYLENIWSDKSFLFEMLSCNCTLRSLYLKKCNDSW